MYLGSEDTYEDKDLAKKGEFVIVRDSLGAGDMFVCRDGKFYRGKELLEELADPAKNGGKDYIKAVGMLQQPTLKPAEYGKDYAAKVDVNQLDLYSRLRMAQWNQEAIDRIILPTIRDGKSPISAMGDDGQVLRKRTVTHLADYFKELFAQITNPALDFLREPESFSFKSVLGPNPSRFYNFDEKTGEMTKEGETPEGLFYEFENPFFLDSQLDEVKTKLKTKTIDITFEVDPSNARHSMNFTRKRWHAFCAEAEQAAREGYNIILSDRNIGVNRQALPDVQAIAAVDRHLIKTGNRSNTSIIVESGQIKDAHHAAVVISLGAAAVNTYLVHELIQDLHSKQPEMLKGMSVEQMLKHYQKASLQTYGKIMAKMGYSTHRNYSGGRQIEGHAIDTKDFDGAFAGIYSPMRGFNEGHTAFASVAAHAIAMNHLADFKALENIVLDKVQESYLNFNVESIYPLTNRLGVTEAREAVLSLLNASHAYTPAEAAAKYNELLKTESGIEPGEAFIEALNLTDGDSIVRLFRAAQIRDPRETMAILSASSPDPVDALKNVFKLACAENAREKYGNNKLLGIFMNHADQFRVAHATEGAERTDKITALVQLWLPKRVALSFRRSEPLYWKPLNLPLKLMLIISQPY